MQCGETGRGKRRIRMYVSEPPVKCGGTPPLLKRLPPDLLPSCLSSLPATASCSEARWGRQDHEGPSPSALSSLLPLRRCTHARTHAHVLRYPRLEFPRRHAITEATFEDEIYDGARSSSSPRQEGSGRRRPALQTARRSKD